MEGGRKETWNIIHDQKSNKRRRPCRWVGQEMITTAKDPCDPATTDRRTEINHIDFISHTHDPPLLAFSLSLVLTPYLTFYPKSREKERPLNCSQSAKGKRLYTTTKFISGYQPTNSTGYNETRNCELSVKSKIIRTRARAQMAPEATDGLLHFHDDDSNCNSDFGPLNYCSTITTLKQWTQWPFIPSRHDSNCN